MATDREETGGSGIPLKGKSAPQPETSREGSDLQGLGQKLPPRGGSGLYLADNEVLEGKWGNLVGRTDSNSERPKSRS